MGNVPPGPTKDVLLQALEDAGRSFERGELAYFAVTSKVEFPVRDRFAWELHRRLEDCSLLVARERDSSYREHSVVCVRRLA
jgi:hypothetical protein